MMLYRNMKPKVSSPDRDTDFFNIVAEVLQGDIGALYSFIICLDNVLQTSIDLETKNDFRLKNVRSRQYAAETIMDADDLALLVNIPAQAESLLYSQKQAARGIGIYVNANKTEYMCFNQEVAIFTLRYVDKYTYHGSYTSSTENELTYT